MSTTFLGGGPILLATDLSPDAIHAAAWAREASRRLDRPVIVTHAIELDAAEWFAGALAVNIGPEQFDHARARTHAWYVDAVGEPPNGVDVRLGGTAQAVAAACRQHEAALLVMERSNKSRLEQMMVGSRVQQVASHPPCPLVVVHPDHEHFAPSPAEGEPRHPVLVATDFSAGGERAVRFAAALASDIGHPLQVFHASRVPHIPALDLVDVARADELAAAARRRLQETLEAIRAAHPDLRLEGRVVHGNPSEEIVRQAAVAHAELVVLGQTGYGLAFAELLGSVPRGVLRQLGGTAIIVPHVGA